jgi:hypothetical protein
MPFIEVARRDIGQVWQKYHAWPDSYARYVQYIWTRYQANNCLLSPIHYDYGTDSIPAPDWTEAANAVVDRFGSPPFGNPLGAHAHHTSLVNFGHTGQALWLTFHQTGNARRDHYRYSLLTEAFNTNPPVPLLNCELRLGAQTHAHGVRGMTLSLWSTCSKLVQIWGGRSNANSPRSARSAAILLAVYDRSILFFI